MLDAKVPKDARYLMSLFVIEFMKYVTLKVYFYTRKNVFNMWDSEVVL